MKIAIVTLFKTLSQTSSVVHVVASQIRMLLAAGKSVKLVVSEECLVQERTGIYADERIEWVGICNQIDGIPLVWHDYWHPESVLHETFQQEQEMLTQAFVEALGEVSVCMLHDVLYLGKYYVHNQAIRAAQKKLCVKKWIALTHSYPVLPPHQRSATVQGRYMAMEHTVYVYPTRSGINALARQYGIPEGICQVVYNPIPMLEEMSPIVQKIHQAADLLSPELLIVYPARLTTGKKLEKVAALVGALKTIGEVSVRIIYCDYESTDIEPEAYKQSIREVGEQYGLEPDEMVFTSELGFRQGLSRASIQELFELSNLYICPSLSESFGMTVLEAASHGNFIIINENVSSLKELGKMLHAYKMKWDARGEGRQIQQTYEPSEAAYYGKHAKGIMAELHADRVFQAKTVARRRFSEEWIWHHQLGPLIEGVESF